MTLQRVAVHVLGRRRFEVSGRFGLRASPGGFATPAFGDGPEVVRVAGSHLVREVGGHSAVMQMPGADLAALGEFVGADLGVPFAAGEDAPELGDPHASIELHAGDSRRIADWFGLAWIVLDEIMGGVRGSNGSDTDTAPATIQLWPEHFDAATSVALQSGQRVNLGFSPGDAYEPYPYLYVGPWSSERPGDPGFWNAPFGAVLRSGELPSGVDAAAGCLEFLRAGIVNASASAPG